jgi:hypothetical protein
MSVESARVLIRQTSLRNVCETSARTPLRYGLELDGYIAMEQSFIISLQCLEVSTKL